MCTSFSPHRSNLLPRLGKKIICPAFVRHQPAQIQKNISKSVPVGNRNLNVFRGSTVVSIEEVAEGSNVWIGLAAAYPKSTNAN